VARGVGTKKEISVQLLRKKNEAAPKQHCHREGKKFSAANCARRIGGSKDVIKERLSEWGRRPALNEVEFESGGGKALGVDGPKKSPDVRARETESKGRGAERRDEKPQKKNRKIVCDRSRGRPLY